jgi:hypothetical protein
MECKNCTLVEMARTMLDEIGLLDAFGQIRLALHAIFLIESSYSRFCT